MNNKYYFDEAGFTGSDLSNANQPYFCLGSARFTDDEILQIKNDLSLHDDTELHSKKLYKSSRGQKRIRALLEHPLMDKKHFKIGIVLKRYCVYAQIVDVLIETMANSLGENIYANRTSLVMANLLYTFAVHHPNQQRKTSAVFNRHLRHLQQEHQYDIFHAFQLPHHMALDTVRRLNLKYIAMRNIEYPCRRKMRNRGRLFTSYD